MDNYRSSTFHFPKLYSMSTTQVGDFNVIIYTSYLFQTNFIFWKFADSFLNLVPKWRVSVQNLANKTNKQINMCQYYYCNNRKGHYDFIMNKHFSTSKQLSRIFWHTSSSSLGLFCSILLNVVSPAFTMAVASVNPRKEDPKYKKHIHHIQTLHF